MRQTREVTRTGGPLAVELFAPGMTALHRVGLAGLAMTLQALESDASAGELRALGAWTVSDRSVTLDWTGDGKRFFAALIAASFRLTDRGLIWFPALGDPLDNPGHAVVLHNATLGTFLQHPRTRKSAARTPVSLTVEVDGESQVVTFLPLAGYAHQKVVFDPLRPQEVAGWLYPGGVVRHVQAGGQTALVEDPPRALPLLYAPVGAIYFQVHRQTAGVRPRYCLVLPAVADLLAYAVVRQLFLRQGTARLQVAGAAEAAARVLAELEAYGLLRQVDADRCEVVAFGTVPWSKQQKTRVERFTVTGARPEALRTYRVAAQALPPRLAEGKPDPKTGGIPHWWVVPQTPDLVAENVIVGAPWWRGFRDFWERLRMGMKPEQRKWALQGERRGLQQMVSYGGTMPDGPEVRLVRACQEAWRRRLGALGERARRQGLSFGDLAGREYERVRISFARCKSAALLRQTLTDFWSRAGGPLPDLQEDWPDVLPFLNERWRDARDLALLALASYKPQTPEEREALGEGTPEPAPVSGEGE